MTMATTSRSCAHINLYRGPVGPIVWQSLLYSGYLPGIQANHLVALLYMGATLFYCARKYVEHRIDRHRDEHPPTSIVALLCMCVWYRVAHVLVSNSYSVVKDKSIEMAESPDDLV